MSPFIIQDEEIVGVESDFEIVLLFQVVCEVRNAKSKYRANLKLQVVL